MHLYVQDMYYNNTLDASPISESDWNPGCSRGLWYQRQQRRRLSRVRAREVPTWHFLEFMSHPAVGFDRTNRSSTSDQAWVGTLLATA